jgi:hypothetical protein
MATFGAAACGGKSSRADGRRQASDSGGTGGSAGGGGANAGDAGAAGDATGGFCSEYVDAICNYYLECDREQFRDLDGCRAALDCYGVSAFLEALTDGRISIDEALLEQCLLTAMTNPCSLKPSLASVNGALDVYRFLQACPGVVIPRQDLGEPCTTSFECQTRLQCDTASSCPGVCRPRYQLGDSCEVQYQQCSVPYGICLNGTCRIPSERGGSCVDELDCKRDLACDPETLTCAEPLFRPGLGETCINDFNGAKPAFICLPGLYCGDGGDIGSPGTCQRLRTEGEPCDYNGCDEGLVCGSLAGAPPVCVGAASEGELCYPGNARSCEDGLNCVAITSEEPATWICIAQPGFGEPCPVLGACGEGLTLEQ